MNNNNIDKLFQENLKNLEATPNKRVWDTIESKLQKKKRKVTPIWWFSGGIAALFLLGFFLFPFSKENNNFKRDDSNTIITETQKKAKEIKNIKDSILENKNNQENILIANDKSEIKTIKNKQTNSQNKDSKKKLVSTKNAVKKIFLADNSIKKELGSTKKQTIDLDKTEKTFYDDNDKKELKKNEKNKNIKKVDIHDFIEKKDSIIVPKSQKNKWAIAPTFAVLNSSSFSNTSPIDNNLSNSTKGNNSFSYGVQVSYKLNKKWTIQSGIHLQEISFINNNVTAISSISKSLPTVTYKNGGSFSFVVSPSQNSDITNSSLSNRSNLTGDLNQRFGYIEIPIEIKYNFISSNKFNSELVAGFSSLFLSKNQVNLNTPFLTKSGEANNLNNINFSGNFGVDFNYSLNNNWSINLNPMFKAQLNTFSENSNGFSPFNIGIYTGLKYQF